MRFMVGIEIMCLVWDIALKNFHQNCGLYLSVCVLQLHIAQVWFGMHGLYGIVMMIVIHFIKTLIFYMYFKCFSPFS